MLSRHTPQEERHGGRYGTLLGSVVIAFAVQGISTPAAWNQILLSILLSFTLLQALWAADVPPRRAAPAILVAVCVSLVSIDEALNGNFNGIATWIAYALLVGIVPPMIIVGVVRNLRARRTVTIEAVLGVLSVYILIGMFFAFLYSTINHLDGGTFFAGGQAATASRCLYFSFVTLTTVGYGDFHAQSNLGHTLSASEALVGQIYLVTVVSLMVANLGRGRPVSGPQ